MEVYRIEITSWTASFRYPNIISGYQPSLFVPPISTVLGIINSCAGKYLDFDSELLGYYFDFVGKTDNIENIHKMEQNSKGCLKPKTTLGIITRQVLFGCRLYIYMINPNIVDYFRKPVFQVTLGRSCDLATIDKIIKLDLPQKKIGKFNTWSVDSFCWKFSSRYDSGFTSVFYKYNTAREYRYPTLFCN